MEEYITISTIREIKNYCNPYGDKLIELMDECGVDCLPKVPENYAKKFLERLKNGEVSCPSL